MTTGPTKTGYVSAMERHAQTVLAGLLTVAISSAVAISWRSSTQIERLLAIVESQDREITLIKRDVRDMGARDLLIEARLARLEANVEKGEK